MTILNTSEAFAAPGNAAGGGGASTASLANLFLRGNVNEAIGIADDESAFHKLFKATTGKALSVEHPTLADALAVKPDRAKIHNDKRWSTLGWKSEAIRTAFLETYPVNKPLAWDYAELSGVTSDVYDLMVSSDGAYVFYRVGSNSQSFVRRQMTTPHDLSTLSAATTVNVVSAGFSSVNNAYRWCLSADGTVLVHANNTAIQYAIMSTPWDLSTLGPVFSVTPGGAGIRDVSFNHDGTKIYAQLVDNNASTPIGNDGWIEGVMSTPYDLTTAVWDANHVWNHPDATLSPAASGFTAGGRIFYCGSLNTSVGAYRLDVPGDLHGGAHHLSSILPSVSDAHFNPMYNEDQAYTIAISEDGNGVYMMTRDKLLKLDTSSLDWTSVKEHQLMGAEGIWCDYYGDQYLPFLQNDGIGGSHACDRISISEDGTLLALSWARSSNISYLQIFRLGTPFDLSTAEWWDNIQLNTNGRGAIISPDGRTVMWAGWTTNNTFYSQRLFGSPQDTDFPVTQWGPLTHSSTTLWHTSYSPSFAWSRDGKSLFIANRSQGAELFVSKKTTGSPFMWSSGLGGANQSVSPELVALLANYHVNDVDAPRGLWVSPDGTQLYINIIYEGYMLVFDMPTPFDVTSITHPPKTLSIGNVSSQPRAVCLSANARWAFVVQGGGVYRRAMPGSEYAFGGA